MQIKAVSLSLAATGVVLLAAACGGSPQAHDMQLSSGVAFSHCMRSNGIAAFPDPTSSGVTPKESLQQLGVSGSRFQTAETACRHLLPNGGRPTAAIAQQVRATGVKFAQCMRAHGVPNLPDPGSDGRIPDPATVGIDQGSPRFEAANQDCAQYRPPYMPSNAAYNAWAATHG